MQRKFKILIILGCLFLSYYKSFSQNDSIHDNSFYFDDKGISEAKNIIKLNIISVLNGDFPVYYERIFGKSFGIEVGAGFLFPYPIPKLILENHVMETQSYGYSLWIQPKLYIQKEAPELSYLGILFIKRNYTKNNKTILYSDITFNYGFQLIFGKRFIFDYNIGVGFRFKKDNQLNTNNVIYGLVAPIGIKLGVIL